jgi:hypothetical protein
MKKIQTSIILSLFVIGVVSCKKTQNSSPAATNGVTTDMAATISSGSLAANSSGMTTNLNDIATNSLLTVNQACGTTLTDTMTKSGTLNGVTYDYFLKYTHMLDCNHLNQNDNIVYNLAFHGHYDSATMSSLDSGTSTFTIAGFTPVATAFYINGEYKRTSTFKMKTGDKVSGTSKMDIVVTNLTLTKPAKTISGGGGTIALTITVPKGTSNYNAPLTFKGDGTATATINGTKYSIDLATGVVTTQ